MARSTNIPLFLGTILSLTFVICVHGDTYRPSSTFSRQSNVVSISPSGTFQSVRSLVECSRVCSSQSSLCQAIIYHQKARECRTFTNRFKRSTDVMSSRWTVYMEKYPPLLSQIIPAVNPSCTTSSPQCMFLSADGTLVTIVSSLYSVYSGPSTLTSGSLVANQPLSNLFVNFAETSIDSCLGFDSGRTVHIIKGLVVYCYEFQVSSLKYVPCASWAEGLLTDVFGSVMGVLPPGPYITQGSITYLFQLTSIVDSNGTVYLNGLGSPFVNCPLRITSISETDDANIYLMASSGSMLYAYYCLERTSVLIGQICA